EALRYTFSANGRQIHVTENSKTKCYFEDISAKNNTEQEQYLTEFGNRDAREPFDLGNGPLIRTFLFKLAHQHHVLRLTAHHIICDGWSFGVLLEELSEIYHATHTGRQPVLPVVIPMSRYNQEMEASISSESYQKTLQYWLGRFKTIPEPLTL